LNASKNGLREAGAKAISEMLKMNQSLTKVDLSDNEIGGYFADKDCRGKANDWKSTPEGPAALADALKSNSTVLELNPFSNKMGPEGGKLLADAIKAHPNYTQLAMNMFDGKTDVEMSNKGLDAGDAFIIAAALEKNDQVTGLHVNSNGLNADAGKLFLPIVDKPHFEVFSGIPIKQIRENTVTKLDLKGSKGSSWRHAEA
jgi:hypothetical protein